MAIDSFIQIGSLKGESKDSAHADWIDVLAWSWGMSNPVNISGGGLSASSPTVFDFSFTKQCDLSSVDMARQLLKGQHHATAVFELRKSTGEAPMVYFKLEMEEVFVTSMSFGGGGGDAGVFTENVALAFKKYKATYTEQASGGGEGLKPSYGYDLSLKQEV